MNTTLTTFLKLAVTVTVIVALLFSVGYQLIMDESEHYNLEIDQLKNEALP
jgi:hypothetical protein